MCINYMHALCSQLGGTSPNISDLGLVDRLLVYIDGGPKNLVGCPILSFTTLLSSQVYFYPHTFSFAPTWLLLSSHLFLLFPHLLYCPHTFSAVPTPFLLSPRLFYCPHTSSTVPTSLLLSPQIMERSKSQKGPSQLILVCTAHFCLHDITSWY